MTQSKLKIIQDTAASCTKCELHTNRTNSVFSRGNPESKLMIIGEAPGQDEDEQGLPFVGRSGQLLNQALNDLGLDINNDIYVCNIIKCRPPGNRKPSDEETNQCFNYLAEQINIIKPIVIVALGATAMNTLINTTLGITKMHGSFTKTAYGLVMPTFHPSYILRSGGIKSNLYHQFKDDIQSSLLKINQIQKENESYQVLEESAYYGLDCYEE